MYRALVATLLLSGTCAFAQDPRAAEDQKQLQGIWRVREVVTLPHAPDASAATLLVFEGEQLIIVGPLGSIARFDYKLDPTKNPKHLDYTSIVPRPDLPGQRPRLGRKRTVPSIYSLEQDCLKVRIPSPPRRPVDFTTVDPGTFGEVLILTRDDSPATRAAVHDVRTSLAIRELGGRVCESKVLPAGLQVGLEQSQGDADLIKIAPQIKSLHSVVELHLEESNVTDAGLASLEGIDNILQMNLEGTAITDAGLEHLRKMPRLNSLLLTGTQVTAGGVDRLKQSLPQLRVTRNSDSEGLSKLAITNAGGTPSSNAAGRLVEIRFARRLNDFQLLGLRRHLEVWKTSLRSIDLTGSRISDRGLTALAGLPSLEQLTLKGTDVTVAGVKSLQRTSPNLRVTH